MQPGDWIALVALAIAIFLAARTQSQLEARLTAIEEQKRSQDLPTHSTALIVCEKRKEAMSSGRLATWIVFRNDGQAVAVDIWFDRYPLAPLLPSDQTDQYPRLAPGQEWKLLAEPTMNDPEQITFRYGWTDDMGTHDEKMVYSVFT